MGRKVANLLDFMASQFESLQGFTIDYNSMLRRMAFIPDTLMITDRAMRDLNFIGDIIEVQAGDVASAIFAVDFQETDMAFQVQDMCDDAWSSLQAFDEFIAKYQHNVAVWHAFRDDYPIYERYIREADMIKMTWRHVTYKHPLATMVLTEYEKYRNRVFLRLEEEDVAPSAFMRRKIVPVALKWTIMRNSGLLGVDDRFIIKPTTRVDSDEWGEHYRYVNIFVHDNDEEPLYTYQQFIDSVAVGIPGDRFALDEPAVTVDRLLGSDNTMIHGMWINTMAGGEPMVTGLEEIMDLAAQIPVIGVNSPFAWKDLRVHLDIRKISRLPQIGVASPTFLPISHENWFVSPWYRGHVVDRQELIDQAQGRRGNVPNDDEEEGVGRVLIRHPFEIVTHVERVPRT
jgi:hypothetical protein